MAKSKVALVRCSSYDEQEVFTAVKSGIELLGGPGQFAARGEKLLLKPNVLVGTPPEQCVCTHPSVLKAVGRIFRSVTADMCFGDSPGPGNPLPHLITAGLAAAAEEIGLRLADFERGTPVELSGYSRARRFLIADGVLEADGIVSLSKLKTHTLTRMTGAVKNLYGCIPGQTKRRYHFMYPSTFDFAEALVALNLTLKPRVRLHIMDGIMGMEGNGPRNGDPVRIGALLFSTDPVALDAVMCDLIELNPLRVPTSAPGRRWSLGTYSREEIELAGDSLSPARPVSFKVERGPVRDFSTQGIMSFVDNAIGRRPVIDSGRCTRCGTCVEACPVDPKALDWHDGNRKRPPSYKYSRCIRCFCCQEICPEGAIEVKHTFLKL